jgi:hypothetical protein
MCIDFHHTGKPSAAQAGPTNEQASKRVARRRFPWQTRGVMGRTAQSDGRVMAFAYLLAALAGCLLNGCMSVEPAAPHKESVNAKASVQRHVALSAVVPMQTRPGEPIPLRLTLTNRSNDTVEWDARVGLRAFFFQVSDSRGNRCQLTEYGRVTFGDDPYTSSYSPTPLGPGGTREW